MMMMMIILLIEKTLRVMQMEDLPELNDQKVPLETQNDHVTRYCAEILTDDDVKIGLCDSGTMLNLMLNSKLVRMQMLDRSVPL